MLVSPEFHTDEQNIRTHPWSVTEYPAEHAEKAGAYFDFIQHPELVPQVLEDFKPYAHYNAIQHFYRFLVWANSIDSVLETTDCALGEPIKNDSFFKGEIRISGRVELLFREHQKNVHLPSFQWMWRMFCLYLQTNRVNFYDGLVEVGAIPTDFVGLPQMQCRGHRLRLTFYAYGDSEREAFDRLLNVFDSIWEAAKRVSDGTKIPMPIFP